MVNRAKIAQLEKALEEARRELWQEDAKRYRILWRELAEADRERILGNLTERGERILFGLEAPEETRRSSARRGELVCSVCGKGGFSKRGLALHTARMHTEERR